MKRIICGDLHGDWASLNQLMTKKRPDMIWQVGDFGCWPRMEIQKPVLYGQQRPWILKGLKVPVGTTVFWCDGNHEDHEFLQLWQTAGQPTLFYDRVYYMPRGTMLKLEDGTSVLFMGGAHSVDQGERTIGFDWFPQENINYAQIDRALEHERVDIVVSHTCPEEFAPNNHAIKSDDPNRKALSAILHHFKPELWYFGHWHTFKQGTYEGTRWTCLDYPKHGTGGRWWIELP